MNENNLIYTGGTLKELVNNSQQAIPSLDTKLSDLVGYPGLVPSEYTSIIQAIITK